MSIRNFVFERPTVSTVLVLISISLLWLVQKTITNLFFSPLRRFPGPKVAAATGYYKTWIQCVQQISWHSHLAVLHARYGSVVRVGPQELHFSDPQAYLDIYNNSNRWDKEPTLYHSFGEDCSSFGFLTYKEAKERRDVLGKNFSARAVAEGRDIVQEKINDLCSAISRTAESTNNVININYAFRSMAVDVITYYCFGTSVDAIQAPGFRAPILVAMDDAPQTFIRFRHFEFYKNMILNCPRRLSRIIAPATAGLLDLQEILEAQIKKLTSRKDGEKTLSLLPHRMTIYHSLLDKSSYAKSGHAPPTPESLYDEAQVMVFAGSETVGNTLMLATFYLSQPANKHHLQNLQNELRSAYPNASSPPPSLSTLENLPYLNAVLKEALRISCGVVSGLPRITPPSPSPVMIASHLIPSGTVVSCGSSFVHYNPTIFPDPKKFDPSRWLPHADGSSDSLETWLIPFSRGPRSCLGVNLAWIEMRLAVASMFRRFEFEVTEDMPTFLEFTETFVPTFLLNQIMVRVKKMID